MKKLIAALAVSASLFSPAHAAPVYGPIWVKFSQSSCDMVKLFFTGNVLFGTEVGCAAAAGEYYAGVIDVSGTIYLTATGSTPSQGQAVWQVLPSLGASFAFATTSAGPRLGGPFTISVSLTKPAAALN